MLHIIPDVSATNKFDLPSELRFVDSFIQCATLSLYSRESMLLVAGWIEHDEISCATDISLHRMRQLVWSLALVVMTTSSRSGGVVTVQRVQRRLQMSRLDSSRLLWSVICGWDRDYGDGDPFVYKNTVRYVHFDLKSPLLRTSWYDANFLFDIRVAVVQQLDSRHRTSHAISYSAALWLHAESDMQSSDDVKTQRTPAAMIMLIRHHHIIYSFI